MNEALRTINSPRSQQKGDQVPLPPITVLTETDLRACAALNKESLGAVAEGFTRLAQGMATVPPIMMVPVPERNGEVDVKSAYVEGLESFAVKIASGFFDNPKDGLPSGSGMMVVLSAETGFPQAVLLDNGYLTEIRTALAGAIAAQYLAGPVVDSVGVIGAGTQGRYQVRALRLTRDFNRVTVYDRDPQLADTYARDMTTELGLEVATAPDPESVVRAAELVVTATPSRAPYLQAKWLRAGQHLTAMGSDSEEKQELDPRVFERADRIVCDRKSQCFRLGELHHARDAGLLDQDSDVTELGELTAGIKPGREAASELTVCDLTGVGVQDTAIALLAYRKAHEMGLGMTVGS
jgi:ornithine cyclodeaminase